ncbi:hypothetical protein PDIG_14750 [Penicillium digitatum PHI26]|uniref:Uncharacterized protein n=2 Tax=Penicillium digitatum TaxID=36651 RepID=K9G6B3_PEND2|nr:hypothetical protein PDIP_02230 [Penicillium digitatum Pd1]EKV17460.1 hypothetical protein PDIG_14750 [Penicillium digitatum PHI26]EKV21908.1 hypothetical protein PDIP_02230 [Penicillium digitatum Pd1]
MPHFTSRDYALILHGIHFILRVSLRVWIIGDPMLTA